MENNLDDVRVQRCVWLVAVAVVLYSAYLAVGHAAQPLLDLHAFRQTQTALTAYWLGRQGFSLAYETPVAGYPWSIPFEFPIFQWVVAQLSAVFGWPLTATGRLTSYAFLLACVFPVHAMGRRFGLPSAVTGLFCAIVFSMPAYVYWGRAFMIETAALFLTLLAAKFFCDYLLGGRSIRALLLFSLFATLAVLQKTTTAVPVLLMLSAAYVAVELASGRSVAALLRHGAAYGVGLCVLTPIIVGYAWVAFTDQVKILNPFGQYLTSQVLSDWNWGTFGQRFSAELWLDVLVVRMALGNLGGLMGVLLLLLPFFVRPAGRRARCVMLVAVLLGIVPLLLFTNLHIVHDYYQTANLIFLAYALAVAIGLWVLPRWGAAAAALVLGVILASNYYTLNREYLPHFNARFDKNDRDLAISGILARELPADGQFVAFGNDWSSSLAYFSGHKGYSVRNKFQHREQVAQAPERYVEPGRLGAVIACVGFGPAVGELFAWASADGRNWRLAETHGCLLAMPDEPAATVPQTAPLDCAGELRVNEKQGADGYRYLDVSGWVAAGEQAEAATATVLLERRDASGRRIAEAALRVPRPDANAHLGWSPGIDLGFSRLFPLGAAPIGARAASPSAGPVDASRNFRVIVAMGDTAVACRFNAR